MAEQRIKLMHVMAGAPHGGAENIFLESVLALCDAPVSQYVVTRPNNRFRLEQFQAHGIPVSTAAFNAYIRGPTRRTLKKAIARFDPDIVQYWMGRAGTFAMRGRAKNVAWYGGYYKLARFKACDHHIGLTKDLVRHIVAQGVPAERTALIHTYAEFNETPPVSRSALSTPHDAPLLLALARLHPKKGLDVLLEALVHVPGAYLWIAGEGPIEKDLKALCHRLGLEERVRFLGWRDDRGALLAAADVCVFPSRYEPFGTVTVDAWAAGTPLVAAAAVGPKAYVQDGQNGLLVPIDDAPALAAAIMRVITDDALRRALVEGGRKTYRAQFTKEVFLRDSLAFYRRIVAS